MVEHEFSACGSQPELERGAKPVEGFGWHRGLTIGHTEFSTNLGSHGVLALGDKRIA